MGVNNPINLIAGPADLYIGNFGAAEPADSAVGTIPSSAAWTDIGATMGGVKLVLEQKLLKLEVDQSPDRMGSRVQEREFRVETSLAEATLTNIQLALAGGTVSSSAAFATYDVAAGTTAATQPTYRALIMDGWAPGATPLRRRAIIRKVLSAEGVKEQEYKRDGQTVMPVVLVGHYVSASTVPIHIVDALT